MRVTFNPDKFGYYTVGDLKTYSKLEAVEWQHRFNSFPDWHFNNTEFESKDWLQEPNIDIWELYKHRARQIRESYDYVVLWYSGGADSHNMITSWGEAGCKIDEIATFWNYDGSKTKDDMMNGEPNYVVFEQIKELQKNKDINFRLVDVSEMGIESIRANELLYNINNKFTVHGFARYLLREKIEDYRKIIASGKRLCFVWGLDKPQVFYDGNHYLQFFDIFDVFVNPYTQSRYHSGWYDEMFYWSPDLPEIVIKQAHIIKRFVSQVNDSVFYQDEFTPNGFNPNIKRYLKTDTLKNLIYPRWNSGTFTNGKSTNKVYSQRDEWFWHSNLPEKDILDAQIKKYFNVIGEYWMNDKNDVSKGIKCHASRKYYVS